MSVETANADFEAGLAALIEGNKESAPALPAVGGTPAAGTPQAPATSPAPGVQTPASGSEETDPRIKALEGIETEDEPKPEEKKESALSDEQALILKSVPNAETAATLYQIAEKYQSVVDVLQNGEFADFEGMLTNWNPQILNGLIEHIYQTRVLATGELVDRFIAEKTGQGEQHNVLTQLKKEMNELKGTLRQQGQQKTAQAAQTADQRSMAAYIGHVEALVAQHAPEKDREFILNTIHTRVAKNDSVRNAIKGGNLKVAGRVAKDVLTAFFNRDKETKDEGAAKVAVQLQKQPLLGGGGGSPDAGIPEDVKDVPKGQEDAWLMQKLVGLKKAFGK